MKLNPLHLYYNKTKKLYYYLNHIFTSKEWSEYIEGKKVNDMLISRFDIHRKVLQCEVYTSNNGKGPVSKCTNKPIYRTDLTGLFVCKDCARNIRKRMENETFTKISELKISNIFKKIVAWYI